MVRRFFQPQLKKMGDKRCVHSTKIQKLLSQLDSSEMITLLTIFHRTILETYKVYADSKGYMNFNNFVSFCTDYEIFPELMTKAALHRVFHSLSFINDILTNS